MTRIPQNTYRIYTALIVLCTIAILYAIYSIINVKTNLTSVQNTVTTVQKNLSGTNAYKAKLKPVVFAAKLTSVQNAIGTNIVLSGFTPDYKAGGVNNTSVSTPPGSYTIIFWVRWGHPNTGTSSQYLSLALFPFSGGSVISPTFQQSNGYSGWPSGSGTYLQMTSVLDVPTGTNGGFTPIVTNNLGATISTMDVSITILQTEAY